MPITDPLARAVYDECRLRYPSLPISDSVDLPSREFGLAPTRLQLGHLVGHLYLQPLGLDVIERWAAIRGLPLPIVVTSEPFPPGVPQAELAVRDPNAYNRIHGQVYQEAAATDFWATVEANPFDEVANAYPAVVVAHPRDLAAIRDLYTNFGQPTPSPSSGGSPGPTPIRPLAVPYFSQWDKFHVGTGDCGPTCVEMVVAAYTAGRPGIADLRSVMGAPQDNSGVTLNQIADALRAYRIPSHIIRLGTFEQVLADATDRPVIVFLDYGDIRSRVDPYGGLHAVVVLGTDGDFVLVNDPDRDYDHSGAQRGTVRWPISEVTQAWDDRGPEGGAVVPDRALEGTVTYEDWLAYYRQAGTAAEFDRLKRVDEAQEAQILDLMAQVAALQGIKPPPPDKEPGVGGHDD